MPAAEMPQFAPVEPGNSRYAVDLLAEAFSGGMAGRTDRARALVRSRRTWALSRSDGHMLAAIVAGPMPDASTWVVEGLAVSDVFRGRGFGRLILTELRRSLPEGVRLMAETDAEAVGFYAACGFSTHSLGEVYTGVERFRCVGPAR